ncbi:MAG: ATP synthase F1 subunit delta [Planctomycetia bacterium]|nr:ATP synthase F1 subunit delta [Planctomycetia bacterium]
MADQAATQPERRSEHFDVGAQRVGALYAQALLGAAESAGQVDAVVTELNSLVSEVLQPYPAFEQLLASEMVSPAEKLLVVERTFTGRVSPLMLNYLKVLADHGRLGYLRAIRTAAEQLHNQLRGRVQVDVTTAVALGDEASGLLAKKMQKMLGREPQLVERVDPALIGGMMLQIGDTVYDGSVATQLRGLRQQIREKNLQQMDTAREKFVMAGA